MTVYTPNYYKKFFCIADKCRHSCCIGWEIDIDDKSLGFYHGVEGDFGKRLAENISLDETPHFILSADERCPFLDKNGLCDIYKELGEENLCNICKDHPRFRNFFENRTEIGLGLCCEASASLILAQKEKFCIEPSGEKNPQMSRFSKKDKGFLTLSLMRKSPYAKEFQFSKRFRGKVSRKKSFDEWISIYLSLEILDDDWKNLLLSMKGKTPEEIKESYPKETENLLNYFVFRHLREGDMKNRLAFCVHCTEMIMNIFSACGEKTFEKLCDIARMYSAEIEYSEDNTDEIMFVVSIS